MGFNEDNAANSEWSQLQLKVSVLEMERQYEDCREEFVQQYEPKVLFDQVTQELVDNSYANVDAETPNGEENEALPQSLEALMDVTEHESLNSEVVKNTTGHDTGQIDFTRCVSVSVKKLSISSLKEVVPV